MVERPSVRRFILIIGIVFTLAHPVLAQDTSAAEVETTASAAQQTFVGIFLISMIAAVFFFAISLVDRDRPGAEEYERNARARKRREGTLRAALALALATDKFSDEACRAAAAADPSGILAHAAKITCDEAERLATLRDREREYQLIASEAEDHCPFDTDEVVTILREADEWPFRVLQEAKQLKDEEVSS